ncbi:MAG: nucleoside triphosphate pyrophosphohydrolase [candidate division WOR-3 bacterium]|jgi:XTP/dITP diphosphohydrolase|nr:nucleoside triphosphate pyrophosphohydrolase [candidate division WOR-3 bacterium]MDH7518535.1 nucleoside triphosphate pyrophosphohydrolase [bacterium]
MFNELLKVIKTLRKKCPWDRKQSLSSTRPLLINEVFELDEALRRKDKAAIQEELGDYLFMGLFLAHLLEEKEGVKLDDVLAGVVEKLKVRHPHIYGTVKVKGADDVLRNWEEIKASKGRRSILSGIPIGLPALQQAQLIQERCRRVGFDWEESGEVLLKVEEEIGELKRELNRRRVYKKRIKEELGDLLFALVNLCRHLGVDAEGALKDANRKFRERFEVVEQGVKEQKRDLNSVSLEEMEILWQRAKRRRPKRKVQHPGI